MKIIKRELSKTFKDKVTGQERKMYGYFIECDNGKLVMIKPVFNNDYPTLDFISVYVKVNK